MKQYDEMMNELEGKFREYPEIPESLSKENIVKTIKEKNIKPEKKKTFAFKMEALAAAVAVIIVAGIVMAQGGFGSVDVLYNDELLEENQVQTAPKAFNFEDAEAVDINGNLLPEGVYTFKDTESAKAHVLSNYVYVKDYTVYSSDMQATIAATNAAAAVGGEPESADGVTTQASKGSFANTNVQTLGVDEGDIIKNDGRYIYVATGGHVYEPRIKIIDTETMQLVYSGKNMNSKGEEIAVDEMYVNGNTLTVVYDQTKRNDGDIFASNTTYVDVYDITSKESPKKINLKTQDGRFLSSRMIGGVLYTVSLYNVMGTNEQEAEKYAVPLIDGAEISGKCIYYFEDASTVYTVVTALDTSKEKGDSTSIAILGGADEVYCSESTIYCVTPSYKNAQSKTEITAFSLDGTSVTCKARGEIPGTYNNNYSFDEYKGYLRAATTYYDYTSYKDVNRVYVLNEELEIVGTSENLSDDEEVKSVRFMGDKGYVVTFRQTDPLFSLDLSDPTNPKVMGELKLPGYSTYLHPLSEKLLLGIGYDGDEENANLNDLKIALFDISDMTAPKLLDEFVIKSSSSDVNYETKALIHYAEKNMIGIPVVSYNYSDYEAKTVKSFAIINYADNEIAQVAGFVHDSTGSEELFRGTYIDEKLYTVDSFKVIEHSLTNGEKLRECVIMNSEEKAELTEVIGYATTVPAFAP